MTNRNKIHIFLGAPAILTQQKPAAPEAVTAGSSKKWLQCQFLYDTGSLIAKSYTTETSQRNLDYRKVTVQLGNHTRQFSASKCEEGVITVSQEYAAESFVASGLEQRLSGECDRLYDKNLSATEKGKQRELSNRRLLYSEGGLKTDEEDAGEPTNVLCTEEGFKTPKFDNRSTQNRENETESGDPNSATLQNRQLKEDDYELPHELLMEYLQNTFPTEGQECCFRHTTVNLSLSTESEFLSVLAASQAAVLLQKCSEGQFNLKTKLKTDVTDTEIPFQLKASTCSSVRHSGQCESEMVCRQADSSRSTPELLNSLSNQRLSASEALGGRTSEGSELLFSPTTDWSEGEVEINIEPYSGGILCSQAVNSAKWSLKNSMETTKNPEELNKEIQKRRSADCLHKDPPSPKRMRTIDYERTSHLGHYLQAMRARWSTSRLGFMETEQLKCCTDKKRNYHVLVTVLFRCLLKEIEIKSGSLAGCSRVPIATIVVTDQSGVTRKVVLWRAAAFWALATFPGDVVLLTDVTAYWDHWQGEEMLQSTNRSKLIKLGPCLQIQAAQWSQTVNPIALKELVAYISYHHTHLLTLGPTNHQHSDSMQYVQLYNLQPGLVVHARLKVVLITVLTENTYTYGGKKQQKIMLTVEQVKDKPGTLTLWGNGISWHSRIQKKLDHVWDFRILLVCQNPITGDLELHTTPWSSWNACLMMMRGLLSSNLNTNPVRWPAFKAMDLSTLLHTRYPVTVELKTHIIAMQWSTSSSLNPLFTVDAFTPAEVVLASLSHFTYSGCGYCGCELGFDENGIYRQCIPCLPNRALKIYYRPTVLTLADGNSSVDVSVSSKLMEKIFLNIPPTCLHKPIGVFDKVTYGLVIADLCCSLFTYPADCYILTVQSQLQLDENSIAMKRDLYLLDFHPDL
ncbi:LOW QUALITY PROTEIN: shieldin complex subunit 2 [Pristis pectinata]|uniref:LOW QUALITY PROTEIN: shieldin complex subunit 2 n=1 Tax=Pristis pectinata TaxID=685728 RepID=UPI00223DDBF8|nr:LOW QUALITY PROTEIN: shieldin complex subunit 2 [Pristis pectinata]